MNLLQNIVLFLIVFGFGLTEYLTESYTSFHATRDDSKLELVTFLALLALVQPLIFKIVGLLCVLLIPQYHNAWSALPAWVMFGILLLGDDLPQYWWHRVSHQPWLWPLHRAHHTAHYMSVRITYRNNLFYYAMMPGLWISGVLIFLGLGNVYLVYVVLKLTIIMGAHCAVPWDAPLYKNKWLSPLMWVVERTISTPATHWAHHAITNDDGIGYYKGNYGNMLFFWDILFGSAHITRQYPAEVGLRDDQLFGKERWYIEMLYPIFKSSREYSALGKERRIYGDDSAPDVMAAPVVK
ncbi:MAG: sterol desaturase family protein [Hyphomicrobiales bacterium]|nr:sterol desaturase family protein [Hyphomicrobiales bacterium]